MILKKIVVKCNNCKTSEVTSIIKVYKSYGKVCPVCNHKPLIDEKDIVLLTIIVLISYLISPINWLYEKITGKKSENIIIESENGATYKIKQTQR